MNKSFINQNVWCIHVSPHSIMGKVGIGGKTPGNLRQQGKGNVFGSFKSPGYGKWVSINSDEAPGKLQASVHEARKPVDILLMRLF